MSGRHFEYLMLTVAVEGAPADHSLLVVLIGGPVECCLLSGTTYYQLAAFIGDWESDDEATELRFATWSVNMRLKFATRRAVDVELVQLGFDGTRLSVHSVWKQELSHDVDDARRIGTERSEEVFNIQFACLAIVIVQDSLSAATKRCWSASREEVLKAAGVSTRRRQSERCTFAA